MKKINYIVLTLLISFQAWAIELKVGDILLQPLHCYSCNLIEAETQSEFSHIGIVIKIEKKIIYVAEAFGKVKMIPFDEFHKKTQKGLKLKVMRPYDVTDNLLETYLNYFDGLPYDSKFLWDDDKIYCSELLQKLFVKVGMLTPKERPMTFTHNRELWFKFFRGEIPDGKLGISPVDFDDDTFYKYIGDIQ